MDNQKVRAHLRKGELAVTLLESLGYKYVGEHHPPRWEAPLADEIEEFGKQFVKELSARITKKTVKAQAPTVCPVRVGDRFTITSLPPGHYLQPYELRHGFSRFTVKSCEWIQRGTGQSVKLDGFEGWIVRFDFDHGSFSPVAKLWLPLSCIKVTSNADF